MGVFSRRSEGTEPPGAPALRLRGRRVMLRALDLGDFEQWREVRRRNDAWLSKWEPQRSPTAPDVIENRQAFAARCRARERERQLGTGYGFGVFVGDRFGGEVNVSSVQRGPFQSAYIGYWVDEALAGHGYTPEAVVCVCRYAFDDLGLHRLQISIIPRNRSSRRVVEKLSIRDEGVAQRYLEIDGVWEDHVRYAITSEEWQERRDELVTAWIA
jgi:ribosomal-protein-alanine N-acetyltransferase